MGGRLRLLALLAVVAAALAMALRRDDAPEPPLPKGATTPAAGRAPGITLQGGAPPAPPSRPEALHGAPASDPSKEGLLLGPDLLHGDVVDVDGTPIADARVYLRPKDGQPPALDAPWHWNARSGPDGRWRLEGTWAAGSVLYAWAPGHERTSLEAPAPEEACRIVLRPSPTVLVTVRAPAASGGRDGEPTDARLRVRLAGTGGVEHPRAHEALAAEWEQGVEPNVPTPVRIPREARVHLAADARGQACEPAFVALPGAAGEVVFDLVPSASIQVRLLDAATRAPLPLGPDGTWFVSLTSSLSGFALDAHGQDDATLRFDRGVAPGSYALTSRYRGYLPPAAPVPVEITRHGEAAEVDVALDRDRTRGVVHLLLRHAEGSHKASTPIEPGLTLVRPHAGPPGAWGRPVEGVAVPRHRRTLEDLPEGTYDILVWNGGRFPAVGALTGLVVEGGSETTHPVELVGGYGFRPTDVLADSPGDMRRVRAQCDLLGVLPWIDNFDGTRLFDADDQGFTSTSVRGYVGPYPCASLRIVEHPPGASPREHALRASIGPPR